MGFDY